MKDLIWPYQFEPRIEALNEKDRIRKEKEISQNNLETFILDIQDKLSQDEFQALTTEEERTQILEKSSEVRYQNIKVQILFKICIFYLFLFVMMQISEWLYDEGSDVEAKEYQNKLQILKDLTGGMFERHREHRDRPEVIAAFKNALNVSTHFLGKLRNATPDEKYLDDDDLDGLQTLLEDNQVIICHLHYQFLLDILTIFFFNFSPG